MNKENLILEMKRKKSNVNYYNVDVATNGHLSAYHVQMTTKELQRRNKKQASSFYNVEDVERALEELLNEENLELIAKWVLTLDSKNNGRQEITLDHFVDKPFGFIYENGKTEESDFPVLVLKKQNPYYRNMVTGMPFDIVTLYLD